MTHVEEDEKKHVLVLLVSTSVVIEVVVDGDRFFSRFFPKNLPFSKQINS